MYILESLSIFENLIKQLIIFFVVNSGLRINEYIRQFLTITNENIESMKDSKDNDNILSSNMFNYLKNIRMINPIKIHAEKIKLIPLDNQLNEAILKLFNSNINSRSLTIKDDFFSQKVKLNKDFNELRQSLNK